MDRRIANDSGRYRPIADYAVIGDERTAALVSLDGSIDWCCLPHFDSPAVFCRLLDATKGGFFRVGPAGPCSAVRAYVESTNVLATTFATDTGRVRILDLMPVEGTRPGILRVVEGLAGEVEVEVRLKATFDWARATVDLEAHSSGGVAHAGGERLELRCPTMVRAGERGTLTGRFHVRAGERRTATLTYGPGGASGATQSAAAAEQAVARTLRYWKTWSSTCEYAGPYPDIVRRSALVLKLLVFKPTGALVAAPTTSLPEEIAGVRNWDYRYTWLRDAALVLYVLMTIGYHDEAEAFFTWLESLCIGCCGDLQILYAVDGRADISEFTLDHLEGYRGSRPVRVGNAAVGQLQLDVYGEVLDAAHLCHGVMRRPFGQAFASVLTYLADQAAARWREPDQGIWEVRSGPRHFLYSKLLCWVALDRAVRLVSAEALPGDGQRWKREREAVRAAILAEGYSTKARAFTQAFGTQALDASALMIPLVGFLPPSDARVRSTTERIQEELTSHGLLRRYLTDDGLPGSEATFVPCSFWLVDNLALQGRIEEARALFERVTAFANDVGLLSEELDPRARELLGNHPQAFSHLALIRAALSIAKAEARGPEEQPRTPAERAAEVVHVAGQPTRRRRGSPRRL